MKIRDFVALHPEADQVRDNECGLCHLHKTFCDIKSDGFVDPKKNVGMECPKCKKFIGDQPEYGCPIGPTDFNLTAVGETNSANEGEEIQLLPVAECPHCQTHLALIPTPIIWNANHNIFYTGGRLYLTEKIDFGGKLTKTIEQYHRRILAGENLQPWILEVWLKGDIEEIIASYLVERGLKK